MGIRAAVLAATFTVVVSGCGTDSTGPAESDTAVSTSSSADPIDVRLGSSVPAEAESPSDATHSSGPADPHGSFEDEPAVEIAALDPTTGSIRWTREWDGFVGLDIVGSVVVGVMRDETDSRMEAVDLETGVPLWERRVDRTSQVEVVGSGAVAYAVMTREIMALDTRTGEVIWRVDSGWFATGLDEGTAVTDDALIVNNDGVVEARSLADGRVVWSFATPSDPSRPAYYDQASDLVVYPSYPSDVYALDPASGELLWQWSPPDDDSASTGSIYFRGGRLINISRYSDSARDPDVENQGRIDAIDPETGMLVWTTDTRHPLPSIVGDSDTLTVWDAPFLRVIDAATGRVEMEWADDSGWTPSRNAAIVNGVTIAVMQEGTQGLADCPDCEPIDIDGLRSPHVLRGFDEQEIWSSELEHADVLELTSIGDMLAVVAQTGDRADDHGVVELRDPRTGAEQWSVTFDQPNVEIWHGDGDTLIVSAGTPVNEEA